MAVQLENYKEIQDICLINPDFNFSPEKECLATICTSFKTKKTLNFKKTKPFQWKIKRTIDLTGSIIGLIIITPLLLLIAAAIKIESKGPVFFKQKRIGLQGREFYMYKFRSMSLDAEKQIDKLLENNETNAGMFKMFNDPRITRIGKFLRKYSIDEIPQLFNVIKGDMSLVGPRPPIEKELLSYKSWHFIRFSTLPGLTGLWQVSGRSKIKNFDKVVWLDYNYMKNWNVLLDLTILLKTIPVVLLGRDSA